MKRLILFFGMIGAGLCSHTAHAAASECFASSTAVFAAHPNASHASYTLRVKKSERCWYADAFNSEAKAKAKPHPAAAVTRTSAPPPAITAPVPQPRTTAVAPEEQPSIMAFASAEQPRTMAFAPAKQPGAAAVAPAKQPRTAEVAPASRPHIPAIAPASLFVTVPFPSGTPPSIQIVSAQELSRLLRVEETPADFESRFSASGYKVRK
jgi:hypothetical protein